MFFQKTCCFSFSGIRAILKLLGGVVGGGGVGGVVCCLLLTCGSQGSKAIAATYTWHLIT